MYAAIQHKMSFEDKKPNLLKISCYFSYFFVSLTILIGLFMIVVAGAPGAFRVFPELNFYVSLASGKISMGYALMNLILPVTAFFGIIQLWHQLRIGFWIFLVSMITLLSLPFMLVDLNLSELWLFTKPLLIITLAMIVLFGLSYKKLY